MRAGEIAEPYPVVAVDTSALVAAQLLAKDRLPGLVVTETDGTPKAVLPASQVVRFMVPDYVQQDPSLARVVGEKAADRIADRLDRPPSATCCPTGTRSCRCCRPTTRCWSWRR